MTKIIPTQKDFSCGGVVFDANEQKLLLVLVENLAGAQVWTFPKGHPEPGETDEQAALREVKEETGWDCEIERSMMDVDYFYMRKGIRYHKVVRWYLMKPVRKTGTFAEGEILDSQWLTPTEAKKRISYDTDVKLMDHLKL